MYTAGKTFAERETWKFVEQHKPNWDVITIHPALIIGPFLHHVDKFSDLNESVRQSYDNLFKPGEDIPPTQVQFWVCLENFCAEIDGCERHGEGACGCFRKSRG